MKNKACSYLTFLILLINIPLFGITTTDSSLIIHQTTLNRFFETMGPISGTNEINSSVFKGKVDWVVTHPSVNILKDEVQFTADVSIKTKDGLFYNSKANGQATLNYVASKNIVTAKIKKASFELALSIFGNRIKLTDIDISNYYKDDFSFPVPVPSKNIVTVTMPDTTQKTFTIKSSNQKLLIEPQQIVITSRWEFVEEQGIIKK